MEDVRPGMVLAKPIMNASGMAIAGAGLTLDDVVIERLKQLGKEAIYVEGTEISESTPSLAEQQRDLEHRFRKVKDDVRQMKIRDTVSAYLRHVAENPSTPVSVSNSVDQASDMFDGGPDMYPDEQGRA
jgi:methyltransferase-like protein